MTKKREALRIALSGGFLAALPAHSARRVRVTLSEQNAASLIFAANDFQLYQRKRVMKMKKILVLGAAAGLIALSACNNTPREQAADNIEANAEARADNIDAMASNATTDAAEDNLQNQADAVRAQGDAKAEDMRTHDADTNLHNGM
ncbi:hypothetical protein [Sphingomonas sp. ABOLE]|uniref:hypothetical protein n=2 Tax=unclassified Sphingomonas TaxID=196159 RepID=UPI001F49E94D|nr:hypothetical protein [Sphingomonas sp. ABOLE]